MYVYSFHFEIKVAYSTNMYSSMCYILRSDIERRVHLIIANDITPDDEILLLKGQNRKWLA